MTKNVLVSIVGTHYGIDDIGEQEEPLEVITPAAYYFRNHKHYIVYDEMVEGMTGTIKNTLKIAGNDFLEMSKSGLTNSKMTFEKDRIYMTNYQTPFGEMIVGVHTKALHVDVQEEAINVDIVYSLDIDNVPFSDCAIKVNVKSVG